MRTKFTNKQLQILKSNFLIESNPNHLQVDRISRITGLSRQVVQVWFQNSRAKQRKYHTENTTESFQNFMKFELEKDLSRPFNQHKISSDLYSFQQPLKTPPESDPEMLISEVGNSDSDPYKNIKRPRTKFSKQQLKVLQSNFDMDRNPDAIDLERITDSTGLSKQVVQVWFQNARAKWRKYIRLKRKMRHTQFGHLNEKEKQDECAGTSNVVKGPVTQPKTSTPMSQNEKTASSKALPNQPSISEQSSVGSLESMLVSSIKVEEEWEPDEEDADSYKPLNA